LALVISTHPDRAVVYHPPNPYPDLVGGVGKENRANCVWVVGVIADPLWLSHVIVNVVDVGGGGVGVHPVGGGVDTGGVVGAGGEYEIGVVVGEMMRGVVLVGGTTARTR
jgi:hypothetical protein